MVTSEARSLQSRKGPRWTDGTADAAHQEHAGGLGASPGFGNPGWGPSHGPWPLGDCCVLSLRATGGQSCWEPRSPRSVTLHRCRRLPARWQEVVRGGRNPVPCVSASWISDTGKREEVTPPCLLAGPGERVGLWGWAACFLGLRWVLGKPWRRRGSDEPGGAAPAWELRSMSVC